MSQNYTTRANLFRVLANGKRLHILDLLSEKEMNVNALSKVLKTRKANTSQHLAYLRLVNLVKFERSGKNCFYSLKDKSVKKLLKAF